MTTIESFHDRLAKIGIEVTMCCNYPWIYLDTVNGIKVKEYWQAEHGFCICFSPIRNGEGYKWNDLSYIFNKIRQVLENKEPDWQRDEDYYS